MKTENVVFQKRPKKVTAVLTQVQGGCSNTQQFPKSVKILVEQDGDSVQTATGRVEKVVSVPIPKNKGIAVPSPYIIQVGNLRASAGLGLLFRIGDKLSPSSAAVACRKGDLITWELLPLV